ncbi:MAG: hypothetical protein JNM47_14080 [Hyphomonadaceae bacterium]|nr:hypothetical protein [Hyphomonadaceae bacterium]
MTPNTQDPLPARISARKIAAIVALGAFALAGSVVPVLAKERQTMSQGVRACKAWCDANNRSVGAQHTCYVRCERYWMCNGSDSTASTCADKPPLSRATDVTPEPPQPAPNRPARVPTRPVASPN